MQKSRHIITAILFIILCQSVLPISAQLGITFDIKKPNEFDDRILGSEKSDQKKFTLPRRFTQNTFTHYNYFFNANNKLNEVLEQAKQQHKDEYSELLSFYNYSLDITAQNKSELDSVIYKASTGIVLHDLRNDWVDNMYLLMGVSHYLQKQFDSAYLFFQFINYAFAEKEKDGYYKNIGSNLDGNNSFSISTREKNNLARKIFSKPPSRNDAFIWQVRTLIALNEFAEAASLIVTLKEDPYFPKRLKNDLEEVQALWYFRNNMFDSAALHLSKALNNAPTKKEKARWEYLVAQLYEISGNNDLARSFYAKVISHTTDPVMEIYARLQSIKINKDGGENYINRNISELLKMARRDKYVDYRDVIYFTMAQMELERGDYLAAQNYFEKSTSYNNGNITLRNKSFLQLADLAFAQKLYRPASDYYDSVNLSDPALKNPEDIQSKKIILNRIALQIEVIERQDSLQKIAFMAEEDRKEFVRKLVRQIRKQQGLKDEQLNIPTADPSPPVDIFAASASKGEWYFYNAALRTKGSVDFRNKWGNRPNVDNWRRSSSINRAQNNNPVNTTDPSATVDPADNEITFESLYNNLPITDELLKKSNDSISQALLTLGTALSSDLEDCASAIQVLEELRTRFPDNSKIPDALFTLFYCYNKTGQAVKAAEIRKQLTEKYPDNPLTVIVTTGRDPRDKNNNPDATKAYEEVYDLFIEGSFEQALEQKKRADAQYGSYHWTPQLLYIESVYYVKQKDDVNAIATLNKIISQYPSSPMAAKALTMIDVLNRRDEIEKELAALKVERTIPKPVVKTDTVTTVIPQKPVEIKPVIEKPIEQKPVITKTDSIVTKPIITPFVLKPEDKHQVMILLHKVDNVWGNEAKNAFNLYNRGKYYNWTFTLDLVPLSGEYKLLLIGEFENLQAAIDYVSVVKPISPTQIIPWLKGDKYSFSVISGSNLELLKSTGQIDLYREFINKNLPGKF